MKICPENDMPIKIIILSCPDNNTGAVVVCDVGSKTGRCPRGRKYICQFSLNPERRYAASDPRFMV